MEAQVLISPSHNDAQSVRCADSPLERVELQLEHRSWENVPLLLNISIASPALKIRFSSTCCGLSRLPRSLNASPAIVSFKMLETVGLPRAFLSRW